MLFPLLLRKPRKLGLVPEPAAQQDADVITSAAVAANKVGFKQLGWLRRARESLFPPEGQHPGPAVEHCFVIGLSPGTPHSRLPRERHAARIQRHAGTQKERVLTS